jgi:hypothetical protein
MALPNEDQFSEEKFMVGDNSKTLYRSEDEENNLGGAFEVLEGDSYTQNVNRNERLAVKAVELAKENEKLKADNAKYKIDLEGKALPTPEKLVDIDTSSLSSFTTSVGESFMNLAKEVPKKIDEIAKDPDKKKNFMRGLEIIEASSGIKPIGQAKSTFGAISEGLLKAEKGFIATDIARLKAQKKEPRRYPSTSENLLVDSMKEYKERQQFKKDLTKSVNERFNIVKKVAIEGKELPTGVLNATFRDLKGVLVELGLGEKYDALASKIASEDYIAKNGNRMNVDEQIIFNDLFQAATFEQVVQDVKKLYPVSNKDIDTLLKTKGDISSRPEALRKLVAAQMATNDIAMASEDFAYKYFELGDQQFEKKSILMSEKMIADKLRKENKVTDTTLEKLFGTTKDITDAGYITAHYYQQLLAQKDEGAGDPFTIFVTAEKEKEAEKDKIIKKYQ